MDTNIILILAGIGGVFGHCLIKLDGLSKDYGLSNTPFNWKKDYLAKDKFGIILSFLSVLLWYLIFGEAAAKYPRLEAWAVTSFVAMGLLGSYLIQLVSSRAKKRLRQIVDAKTNVADQISLDDDGPGGNPGQPPPTPPPTGPGGPGSPKP